MIRKFGGSTGIDIQPQGLDLGLGSGSNIKNIQRGSISTATSNTVNVTIPTPVDLTKAVVIVEFFVDRIYTSDDARYYLAKAKLTSSTNIEIATGIGASMTSQIGVFHWTVIEFNNVKSLQKGTSTLNLNNAELAVNISNIDINKSMLFYSYTYDVATSSGDLQYFHTKGRISSNTQLAFRSTMNSQKTVEWTVIEFL